MPRINNKGLITNNRQPKDVYYYFQASWTKKPVVHIAVDDWQARVAQERTMPIKVYSNRPWIELTHNGVSLGKKEVKDYQAQFEVSFTDGANLFRAIADNGEDAASVSYRQPKGEIAVNVGSKCYFQSSKSELTWLPDQPYREGCWGHIGGNAIQTQTEIHLTADGPLYQTARDGMEGYRFDVPNGKYEVELLFCTTQSSGTSSAYLLGRKDQSSAHAASFSVNINGQVIESELSAPQPFTAIRRRYITDNNQQHILVTFNPAGCLSGIKIRRL